MIPMSLDCLNCGSDNTQPITHAYEQGLSFSDARLVGAALSANVAVGGAIVRGATQNAQSKRLAPPVESNFKAGIAIFGFLLILMIAFALGKWAISLDNSLIGIPLMILAFAIVVMPLRWFAHLDKAKKSKRETLRKCWERLMVCQRCGIIFERPASENESVGAYDAVLLSRGENGAQLVKALSDLLSVKPVQALAFVKNLPSNIKRNCTKDEAARIVITAGSLGALAFMRKGIS